MAEGNIGDDKQIPRTDTMSGLFSKFKGSTAVSPFLYFLCDLWPMYCIDDLAEMRCPDRMRSTNTMALHREQRVQV